MTLRAIGDAAEQQAATYLKRQGTTLLAKNHACRYGEIDLIIEDDGIIAFVEVRRRDKLSAAAASIDEPKQRRLTAAARDYIAKHGDDETCYRFDVVLVDATGALRWLKDAFWASGLDA